MSGRRKGHKRVRGIPVELYRRCPICREHTLDGICLSCLIDRLFESWFGLAILRGYSTGQSVLDCMIAAEDELHARTMHTQAGRNLLKAIA